MSLVDKIILDNLNSHEGDIVEVPEGFKPANPEEREKVRNYFESGFEHRLGKCFDACKQAGLIQSKVSNNIFYFDTGLEAFLAIQCDSRTDGKTIGIIDGSKDFHEWLEKHFFESKEIDIKEISFFGDNITDAELKTTTEMLTKLNNYLRAYGEYKPIY